MPACSVGSRHSSPLSLPPSSTPSEHRRRHRAASDQSESGCDELDGEPAPKKPRSHEVKLNLLMRDVKRYVRTDYPFLKFSPIFQAALHYTPLFEGLKENESLDFENERYGPTTSVLGRICLSLTHVKGPKPCGAVGFL